MALSFDYLTREAWINRYEAENSRSTARVSLMQLDKFLQSQGITESELFEQLRKQEPYLFLDSLVQSWKGKLNPVTIKSYFTFIRSWFRTQGVKTEDAEIKVNIKFPKRIREIKEPLTYDIIKLILKHSSDKYQAYYLLLGSSGMRPSEPLKLKLEDIDINKRLIRIKAEYTKIKQERYTCFSVEAAKALAPMIEGKTPTDNIFPMVYYDVANQMAALRKRIGKEERYLSRVHKITAHAFRAFFRTKAGSINRDIAEMLVGHTGLDEVYVRLTPDELLKEYKKIEPLVTINREHYLTEQNQDLREKLSSIEDLKKQMSAQAAKIKRLEMINA